jgi:hypothetical protein
VVTVIENGGYKPALLDRLDELESQRGGLRERLARASSTPPDIHPNVSEIFRAKVARLADTLNDPADRGEAAQAIRNLITRVVLTPADGPGELEATLEGELGTILEWIARQTTNSGRTKVRGVSVSIWPRPTHGIRANLGRMSSLEAAHPQGLSGRVDPQTRSDTRSSCPKCSQHTHHTASTSGS